MFAVISLLSSVLYCPVFFTAQWSLLPKQCSVLPASQAPTPGERIMHFAKHTKYAHTEYANEQICQGNEMGRSSQSLPFEWVIAKPRFALTTSLM